MVGAAGGQALKPCQVALTGRTGAARTTGADAEGYFALPLLSPGAYRLRVECPGYQAQQVEELRLPVAGTLNVTVRMRALTDVFEQQSQTITVSGGAVLPFYGPDIDLRRTGPLRLDSGAAGALEPAVSYVVEPSEIAALPLAGRDVYALLVTVPGVTTETATSRGLGLSANGQRPSSSSFLLDGVENNNFLISGPDATVQPEAIQEYKVTTSGFAAEYGRTAGLLANAVTVPGAGSWHGFGYYFFRDDSLNAAEFQRNRLGFGRRPMAESQPGFGLSGPLQKERWFASATTDYLRFLSEGDKVAWKLATTSFSPRPGSYAASLWEKYPNRPRFDSAEPAVTVSYAPPAALRRWLFTPRLDYAPANRNARAFFRAAVSRLERPDFIWSPYRDFSSPLIQNSANLAGGLVHTAGRHTLDIRAAWADGVTSFDRAHPEVPVMQTYFDDGTLLPGSPASYGFRHETSHWEFVGNWIYAGERHLIKAGGSLLLRSWSGYLTLGKDGYYAFATLADFGNDRPDQVRVSLSRLDFEQGRYVPANFDRRYTLPAGSLFLQDSAAIGRRIRLNAGIRYEFQGVPRIDGPANDVFFRLGGGPDWSARFRDARTVASTSGQLLCNASRSFVAPRVGVTIRATSSGSTLVRAAWGLYYDRLFDNLSQNLQNNSFILSSAFITTPTAAPIDDILPVLQQRKLQPDLVFSRLGLFPDQMSAPRISSYFAGIEHQLAANLDLQAYFLGSDGSHLIATDIINRLGSVPSGNRWAPYRADLPRVIHRTNLGESTYRAFTTALRYRTNRTTLGVVYTLGFNHDNQSEPLAGDFYDLGGVRAGSGGAALPPAAFSLQFDPSADWGRSDYDQRHNFSVSAVYEAPYVETPVRWLLRDWRVSSLFAIRSGFPFSVFSVPPPGPEIANARPDQVRVDAWLAPAAATAGGKRILDPEAFTPGAPGRQGTSPRNAFSSPSYFNFDFSLARTVPIPRSDRLRLTFRADAFNLLNHTNLASPDSFLGSRTFGVARYGRTGRASAFPALTPYTENPRQLQLSIRFDF